MKKEKAALDVSTCYSWLEYQKSNYFIRTSKMAKEPV
jgi:hypothetical protein